MPSSLLTARQVALILGLQPATVLRWVRDGKLPAIRLPSGQLRFTERDLDAWLAAHRANLRTSDPIIIGGEERFRAESHAG
jgi:excisionase family DNA binding protein